jgi:hypothetical protein
LLVRTDTDPLHEEIENLSRSVHETFGANAYELAIIRAAAVAKLKPNDPRAVESCLAE